MRGFVSLTLAAVLLAASLQADAGGGHRHRHSRAHVGVFIGAPLLLAPWWVGSSSYYYPPPPVIVRERVIVREPLVFYDEHGNPVPADAPQAQARPQPQAQPQAGSAAPVWYYCRDTQTYYPYARTCASAWQRVTPHPPPPSP